MKTACSVTVFQPLLLRQRCPEQGEGPHPAPSPGNHTQHLSISASGCQSFNCISEHLGFISICFVSQLARCIPRYQKCLRVVLLGAWECSKKISCKLMGTAFSLYSISAYGSYQRNALLSGETWIQIMVRSKPFKKTHLPKSLKSKVDTWYLCLGT